ncbi:MAG: hypothetical protein ACI8U3_003105 [Brevundimonas sp.]|jgi:hypothetical protein|uniref:DUF4387 domain-containing protein n=1 Tax=Brevundimonas sp. TaxID=1871086 RepID=UPI0039E5E04E
MPRLKDVCRHVRSKNAGPYWVTIDIFFHDAESFTRFGYSDALGAEAIGALFGADPAQVKRFAVPGLNVVKISYPRASPQGGEVERDMHCGQQYVRLLDIELSPADAAAA